MTPFQESERRLEILRTKAGKTSKLVEYDDFLNQKNVNLFEEEEQKVTKTPITQPILPKII